MKLLITSDIHSNIDFFKEVCEKYKDYTKINLGDRGNALDILKKYNFICVDGNCDDSIYGLQKIIVCDNFKILLTHGHYYNVKNSILNLFYTSCEEKVDYVFFGHTHIQTLFKENNITFLNPGAIKDRHYAIIVDNDIKLF